MDFANVLSSGGTWYSCFLATFSLQRFDWLTRVLLVKGSSDSAVTSRITECGKGNKLGVDTQRFVDDAELVI